MPAYHADSPPFRRYFGCLLQRIRRAANCFKDDIGTSAVTPRLNLRNGIRFIDVDRHGSYRFVGDLEGAIRLS